MSFKAHHKIQKTNCQSIHLTMSSGDFRSTPSEKVWHYDVTLCFVSKIHAIPISVELNTKKNMQKQILQVEEFSHPSQKNCILTNDFIFNAKK